MTTPSEPTRFLVHQALVRDLLLINQRSSTTPYFTSIRKVYYSQPDEWDRSELPALCVYPMPVPYGRELVGGTRTVKIEQPFEILGVVRDDRADSVTLSQRTARLVADINRAIYFGGTTLGLSTVQRVVFPVGAVMSPYLVDQKPEGVQILYQCLVKYSEQDDNP